MICEGINNGTMSRSLIFTTSISGDPKNSVPLAWKGNPKQRFSQNHSFPLPSELLTAAFVRKNVRDKTKQAVLLDKKQPHSDLLAIHGHEGGMHIFDKTHGMWLACL